jgi:hypothetical protein
VVGGAPEVPDHGRWRGGVDVEHGQRAREHVRWCRCVQLTTRGGGWVVPIAEGGEGNRLQIIAHSKDQGSDHLSINVDSEREGNSPGKD